MMEKAKYYTTDKPNAKRELILFFIITFAIMYGMGALGMIFRSDIEKFFGPINNQNLYVTFLIYSPTISSLILTAIFEKGAGLVALFRRAVFSTSPLWWAVGILIWPAMWFISGILTKDFNWQNLYLTLPLTLFSSYLFTDRGSLGEELGWRGFALPRLLQYHNPLISTIILSVVWGLFHLPAFLSPGIAQHTTNVFWWSLALISVCFIMTWLYIRGGGNWIMAGLVPHYIFNTSIASGAVSLGLNLAIVLGVAVIIILLCDMKIFLEPPAQSNPGFRPVSRRGKYRETH